jgi:DNA polymerase-2
MNKEISGWILDIYPVKEGICLWIIDQNEKKYSLTEPFSPYFYLGGSPSVLRQVLLNLSRLKVPIVIDQTEGIEFYSNQTIPVLRIQVHHPLHYTKVVQWCIHFKNELEKKTAQEALFLYNCDISIPQAYFFQKGSFPLAFCHWEVNDLGQIQSLQVNDSIWDTDYRIPPLSTMTLRMEGEPIRPDQTTQRKFEIGIEGKTHVLELDQEDQLVEQFNQFLIRYDPDLILSEWGDPYILPSLIQMAKRHRLPLALNRASEQIVRKKKAHSYFSYGQIIHKSESRILFGRLHVDLCNSFLTGNTQLEGLFEFARLAKIPIQQMARTSPGTGISSMQMDLAWQDRILIPFRKKSPEGFKSAATLLHSDKGGLIYSPKPGFYEEVAEFDFVSMYPFLMVKYNISPETINCACCPDNKVPEIGHHLCTKRRGLIPRFLEPLLNKRLKYKHLKKTAVDLEKKKRYDDRQSAIKWGLVTTFGYQGFKNARFGKIESHEAINAYSREKLLQAKEVAEAEGFQLLHAIVDSLWIKKPNTTDQEYEALARKISDKCEIPISYEGIYRWLITPPSKTNPLLGVPNRYLGVFGSGEIKLRGIEARRSDTAPFIRKAQIEMIEILAQAKNMDEYRQLVPQVMEVYEDYLERLCSGRVTFSDLAISRSISKEPKDYEKETLIAIVAKELSGRGVHLSPGQDISYVITDTRGKVSSERARALGFINGEWSYDAKKYGEMLYEAMEILIPPL